MLIQKFWKKRVMVMGAMVFILTLFALNLNALVKGKVEINQAKAWRLWFFGLHTKCEGWDDINGNGVKDPGETFIYCCGNGFTCFSFYTPWG